MSRAARRSWAGFSGFAEILGRFLVPAAAGLTLASIVVGRSWDVQHELHLVAPVAVPVGSSLPVRAYLYAGLRRAEGPHLEQAPVTLRLLDGAGAALVEGQLRAGYLQTMEGVLELPPRASGPGPLTLEGVAMVGEHQVRVRRSLVLVEPKPPSLPPGPRTLAPLSRFAAGPVRAVAGAAAPDRLVARISGGACVPEHPCEIFVHVGEPAASLRVEPSASVTPVTPVIPVPGSTLAPAETAGIVRLEVVTHGPEAHLDLRAERAGVEVARRALRLPVALAVVPLRAGARVLSPGDPVVIGLDGDERGCIVDVFAGGRWLRSVTLPDCRSSERLPERGLPAGPLRLQVRRDPFGAEAAAVRVVYRRRADETDMDMLARLALAARLRTPDDALARSLTAPGATRPVGPAEQAEQTAAQAGYLLALLEDGLFHPPATTSSYPAALAELEARRGRVRTAAVWMLGLCGLALAMWLALRGLRAGAEAERIMNAAGEAPAAARRQRLRRFLRVAAVVLSLLLAFAAIALYVIARASGP